MHASSIATSACAKITLIVALLVVFLNIIGTAILMFLQIDCEASIQPNSISFSTTTLLLGRENCPMAQRRNFLPIKHDSTTSRKGLDGTIPQNCWIPQPSIGKNMLNDDNNNNTFSQPLPTPIIVVGLPKSGTSSLHTFFNRSGYDSSHWHCDREGGYDIYCGKCIHEAVEYGLDPLKECGSFEVWSQMDVALPQEDCYFPQITDLPVLHQYYPHATFILNLRNPFHWADSMKRWDWMGEGQRFDERLAACKGIGPPSISRLDLARWYCDHVKRIRNFVKSHQTHALVEIDIEDPVVTPQRLAYWFKSSSKFWSQENESDGPTA